MELAHYDSEMQEWSHWQSSDLPSLIFKFYIFIRSSKNNRHSNISFCDAISSSLLCFLFVNILLSLPRVCVWSIFSWNRSPEDGESSVDSFQVPS